MLFPTTIAGSLPKPEWLAEPNILWAPWKSKGEELVRAKRDATLLALKLQEDSGIDIVTEGEQARQHFVHGFLEFVDGIDFAHKVEMGIRGDRYKAMVPVVNGELKLKGRVHQLEARHARAHTKRKLKITLPGPMTISDTVADSHYGDKVKMAMAIRATNAHWKMKDILPRHWVALGKRYGILDDDGRTVEALIEAVAARTPQVVAGIDSMLPAGFPASVSEPILRGLEFSAGRLVQ